MIVIKRDGREVLFDDSKIMTAIQKANGEVPEKERATVSEINLIISNIKENYVEKTKKGTEGISVEEIQDLIEKELVQKFGLYELAKKYIIYRYNRELVRKSNTTDDSILSLLRNKNKGVMEENSNKNPSIA